MVITKQKLAEYFNYTLDFEFLAIVFDIISSIEKNEDEEAIYNDIDIGLYNDKDQWTILMFYCRPTKANFDEAYNQFCEDIFSIVKGLKNENQSK